MASQQSHKHHYVPEWYQKRFLPAGEQQLHVLDLKPPVIQLPSGLRKTKPPYRRMAPSQCFCEEDLYMLRFAKTDNDIIEKQFFGIVDRLGAPAVEVFDKITGFTPDIADGLGDLLPYMGAQRFRTPRGLDWLKERTQGGDRNAVLMMMQRWFQRHTTMWGEGVWEIVRSTASDTKFIVSGNPVTFYNQVLYPTKNKYPGIEEWPHAGTRTVFPLSSESCLIITHMQYVRDPHLKPQEPRVNAREFETVLTYMGNIQYGRQLTEEEVIKINLILKLKATRFIAAGNRNWLLPEQALRAPGWANLDNDWFLMPNPWKVPFSTQVTVGYNDGSTWTNNEYGRKPWDPDFKDEKRREKERKNRALVQHAWSKKRAGKSLSRVYESFENNFADRQMKQYLDKVQPKR